MASRSFHELLPILLKIVPAVNGSKEEYLNQQFSDDNLTKIIGMLGEAQRLDSTVLFHGKTERKPWIQAFERIYVLLYVLEHEEVNDPLQEKLISLIEQLANVNKPWIDINGSLYLKELMDQISNQFSLILTNCEDLLSNSADNIKVLCAMREMTDWVDLLQYNTLASSFESKTLAALKPTLKQFQDRLETRITALREEELQQRAPWLDELPAANVPPEGALPQPPCLSRKNLDRITALYKLSQFLRGGLGLTIYYRQFALYLATVLSYIRWLLLHLPVKTQFEAPSFAPPEAGNTLLPSVRDERFVTQPFSGELVALSQILRKLNELQRNDQPSPEMRILACGYLAEALGVIHKSASDPRKPLLENWRNEILDCRQRYQNLKVGLGDDTCQQIDQTMQTLLQTNILNLRRAYESSVDNRFEKIWLGLFNFIKRMFQCSTLSKVERVVSRCTIFGQLQGVPTGASSMWRSDSRLSLRAEGS